jgi:hypothetical protein
MGLLLLEFKKLTRNSKMLVLPVLFYLLASIIMLCFGQDAGSWFRIFLWILVSLSLKLSFGAFLHEDAEKNLLNILIAQRFPISRLLLLKVGLSTLIFSGVFMMIFLALLSIRDVMIVPVFVGSLFVLQACIEVLTLQTKVARYLCYLLLLPFEIPLFILVISQSVLSTEQLVKTMGGILLLGISVLLVLCGFVFRQNKNTCNF